MLANDDKRCLHPLVDLFEVSLPWSGKEASSLPIDTLHVGKLHLAQFAAVADASTQAASFSWGLGKNSFVKLVPGPRSSVGQHQVELSPIFVIPDFFFEFGFNKPVVEPCAWREHGKLLF